MDDLRFVISVEDRDLIRAQKEQRKFERNLLLIEQAFRKGDITAGRYSAELNKQASALSKLGGSYKTANSEVRRYSSSIRKATDDQLRLAQATNMAGRSTNRFGMYAQQVGYQVGDFFVQVQSGTSALVAFGQQGTQLAGLLPGVTGAVVGISLAVGTMLLRTLQQAQKAAKESADVFGNWEDALKSASKVTKELTRDIHMLRGGFEDLTEATYAQKIVRATEVLQKAEETLGKKTKGARAGNQALVDLRQAAVVEAKKAVEEAEKELDLYREQRKQKKALLEAEEERFRLHNQRFAGEEALMNMSLSMSRENLSLTKKNQEADIRRHNQRFADEESVMGMALSLSKENIALTKKNQEADIRRHNQRFADEESLMAQSVTMSKETIALIEKVANARKRAFNQRFADETFLYKQRFAGEDSLMGMSLTPSKQDFSFYTEQQEAQKEFLATLRLSTQEQLMTAGLKDRELLVAEQFNETYRTKLELDKLGIEYGSARYERALETLKTEQDSILYVYDRVEAEKKLTEEKEKQGKLIETVGGIIGDGFMSMIEGTESVKDAFKSMARAIIKELYQILVVQQMVNAAKTAMGIPFADGGVFSGGSQVQAYADGGVVGSPTTFPMSGGKTGLMGEAGPEAIMPLKRGSNGKLGVQMEGGATTTVVQNFNFSANGDESVKKLIAQAAPKIADMTKSSLLNDRRRGGTTKAVFG